MDARCGRMDGTTLHVREREAYRLYLAEKEESSEG